MDLYRRGCVSINDLACFMRGARNFNINDRQLYCLMGLFGEGRHGISRDAFIQTVGSPDAKEEE